MRKLRILPALLALALVIAGCKGPSVPVPESASHLDLEKSLAISGTATDGGNTWEYRIMTYTVTGERCADDGSGRVLTRHSYQTPTMEVRRAEGEKSLPQEARQAAEQFNAHFQQLLQKDVDWYDEMTESADEFYRERKNDPGGAWMNDGFFFTDESTLDFWSNGRLVCVTTNRFNYSGGVHGNRWITGEILDLRTGTTVTVADMTDDVTALEDDVTQELLRQAEEKQKAGSRSGGQSCPLEYYEDYPETLGAWMDRPVVFDDDGMVVTFNIYDITSYADGEQTFLIPYAFLRPYLNDFGARALGLEP